MFYLITQNLHTFLVIKIKLVDIVSLLLLEGFNFILNNFVTKLFFFYLSTAVLIREILKTTDAN